jgi:hypothetical protein
VSTKPRYLAGRDGAGPWPPVAAWSSLHGLHRRLFLHLPVYLRLLTVPSRLNLLTHYTVGHRRIDLTACCWANCVPVSLQLRRPFVSAVLCSWRSALRRMVSNDASRDRSSSSLQGCGHHRRNCTDSRCRQISASVANGYTPDTMQGLMQLSELQSGLKHHSIGLRHVGIGLDQ